MVSILKRSLTSFRLMVLKTSACIDASEARTKAKLSTDICKSYDNIRFINGDFVATVVKTDDVGTWGGGAGVDDEQEEVIFGKILYCGTTSMGEVEEQSIARYSWSKFKSAHPSDFWIGPSSDAALVTKTVREKIKFKKKIFFLKKKLLLLLLL